MGRLPDAAVAGPAGASNPARGNNLMEIYVGNLSYGSTEDDIRGLFSIYGTVERVSIVTDRETGRSRGFCFIGMPNEDEAREAIEALNGVEVHGRTLAINEARPRAPRTRRADW